MGFLFFRMISMGLRLAALRSAGAPLLKYQFNLLCFLSNIDWVQGKVRWLIRDTLIFLSQLTNLRSQLDNLWLQLTILQLQLTNLRSQITNLRSQLTNLRSQLNNLQLQLTKLLTTITTTNSLHTFLLWRQPHDPSGYYQAVDSLILC